MVPILHAKCAECHRPDQVAPFSLLTYDDTAGHDVIAQNPEIVAALVSAAGVLNVVLRLVTSLPISSK